MKGGDCFAYDRTMDTANQASWSLKKDHVSVDRKSEKVLSLKILPVF
jgi:hypothetical protein